MTNLYIRIYVYMTKWDVCDRKRNGNGDWGLGRHNSFPPLPTPSRYRQNIYVYTQQIIRIP